MLHWSRVLKNGYSQRDDYPPRAHPTTSKVTALHGPSAKEDVSRSLLQPLIKKSSVPSVYLLGMSTAHLLVQKRPRINIPLLLPLWTQVNILELLNRTFLQELLVTIVRLPWTWTNLRQQWKTRFLVYLPLMPILGQPVVIRSYGLLAAKFVRWSSLYRTGAWSPLWDPRPTTCTVLRRANLVSPSLWQVPRDLTL